MDRIILTITSDLFDDNTHQEASVRRNLSVRALITEIQREFSLPPGNYVLAHSTGDPLEVDKTMEQLNIQTGVELLFSRQQRQFSRELERRGDAFFRAIAREHHATVQEKQTGQVFSIEWQPAIIGRPDAQDPTSAETIAVNLGTFEAARSVSRKHARITEQDGQYYLEGMAKNNPTYLNDESLMFGEKRGIKSGDLIRVGKIELVFQR